MEYFIKYHDDSTYYKVIISKEIFDATLEIFANIGDTLINASEDNRIIYTILKKPVYTLKHLDVSRNKKTFRMYPLVKVERGYVSLEIIKQNSKNIFYYFNLSKNIPDVYYGANFFEVKDVNRMMHTAFLGLKQKEYEELNPFMDNVIYFTTNKDEALHREKFINSAIEDIEYAKYAKIATKCQWTIDPSQRICDKCICESCIDRSVIPDIELIKKGLNSKYQVFSRKKRF